MIATYPTDFEIRKLSINGKDVESYYVLKYYPGDRVMPMRTQKDTANCIRFLTVLLAGKIPETIPMNQLYEIWNQNFVINGYKPAIPPSTMEACLSVLCRDKNNLNTPFRKVIGQKNSKASETDYFIANISITPLYFALMIGIAVVVALLGQQLYGPVALFLGFTEFWSACSSTCSACCSSTISL